MTIAGNELLICDLTQSYAPQGGGGIGTYLREKRAHVLEHTGHRLLQIVPGAVLELDRRVGEAIDIFVNERLVARGEVVVVEDRLGVTMTEIIKADR